MTAAIRRRKRPAEDDLPADLLAWFRGDPRDRTGPPWSALIFPDCDLLRDRWKVFAAANPGAKPPPGFEYIAEPEPPLSAHQQQVRDIARALARKHSR
jgi:hypothetical protein